MLSRLTIAVATTVLMIATSCSFPTVALDESASAQVPGVYPFKLGDFTITALSDGTLPQYLHTKIVRSLEMFALGLRRLFALANNNKRAKRNNSTAFSFCF
ncbi:hypothetical protein [Chroococcidiopsis sp. CCMEE 29]|uniref:hypothetical protein n=1 Tax=Chroococcidiopsis sp. CCMEE 29 TaxID=155894 RepID=UPI0020201B3B|nr:hypothetical protein [Chroococcidiopsis sp. CCMEE 29]